MSLELNRKRDQVTYPCSDSEFSAFFLSFKKSAFRLELNQSYLVEKESAEFTEFLAGRIRETPSSDMQEWCKLIKAARLNGKIFQRVRRIAYPLTNYTRFEIA